MSWNPGSLLAGLRPRTLAGQTILVAAASLFLVQLIAFGASYLVQRNQWVSVAAAPGVIVILDALDQRDRLPPPPPGGDALPAPTNEPPARSGSQTPARGRYQRAVFMSADAPPLIGQETPAIADRARDMLHAAGLNPLAVRAAIEPLRRHNHIGQILRPPADRPPRLRVQLSVQVRPNRWITAFTPVAPISQPILPRILVQTLFLYGMVLIPLVWFTRRLADPLRALAKATRLVGTPEGAGKVPETGPDDVRGLAASFNVMQDRIRSMLEEKDHMLGAIGHDLRTPLTALRVRVESVPDGPDRDRMVATIDVMRQMLDDILVLARIGRDREPPQRVDLAALAEAAIDDFLDTGAAVTADDMPRAIVSVHPRAIRRALTNLVDNAVKYGSEAHVLLRTENGRAILTVADKGPGIAPERLDEMQQPFTRIEASRSRDTGGTGLGLAIVRAIASAEAGQLRLGNRPEGGLLAELILPLAR